MNVHLIDIELPKFGVPSPVEPPSVSEIEMRLFKCRELMKSRLLSHLIVYGDREHFANLMYLTHFDPRFEQAILVVTMTDTPLILVGNECVGHLSVSPLFNDGKLRYERYQPLSLLSQPRDCSRTLNDIFCGEGISTQSSVGCVGWSYFTVEEFESPEIMMEIPSYIVDTLRKLCNRVVNATDLLMSPSYGLRAFCSPYEISYFEYSNVLASEGMINLLRNFRADVTDFELVGHYNYCGLPLNCHVGMKSSGNQHYGLSSPCGAVIRRGEPCSTNIGYWGSNICRAGWVAEDEYDLPDSAKGYVENFAAPYFLACREWFRNMRIGTSGGELQQIIDDMLPFDRFGVFLNPGHLTHMDEWVSSPIYRGSQDEIRSGMYFQVDIIPRSPQYFSSRMEDGIVIADAWLREQLRQRYPNVYERCMLRRAFMEGVLGFDLPDEVLPLSNMPAVVPPFFLNHKKILSCRIK